MTAKIFILSVLFTTALAGCQTQPVKSFESGSDTGQITADEKNLWLQSKRFDKSIRKLNSIYKAPEATAYLQNTMDKLYPEFTGKIKVKIVKTPMLNAFALPNGSVYMHLGILARLENEAQLATILAHEGAHFIHKHSLKQSYHVKNMSAFAISLALAGIPFVGDLIALSSISGYSQEYEFEADKVAYDRIKQAGYDTQETTKGFEFIMAEVKALDLDEPYFFASHPKLQDRIDNFNQLNKENNFTDGLINKDIYHEKMKQIREDCIKADIQMHRYQSVILVLTETNALTKYGNKTYYYLGEAYRMKNEEGDLDKAVEAYKKSINLIPDFAPNYQAIGLYYMKTSRYDEALASFEKYLDLAIENDQTGYVKSYIKKIEKLRTNNEL